jgi:hypothetical protein
MAHPNEDRAREAYAAFSRGDFDGPSQNPTASETPHQAARPIATHHHAFMSALQQAVTARRW